ncbi:MAG: CARDB domain-containing protein, partial [bacterium]
MFKCKKSYVVVAVIFVLLGLLAMREKGLNAQAQGLSFRVMIKSDSGDYIGQNKSWDFSNANNSKISIQGASDSVATFKTEDFAVSYMTFGFASESGKKLAQGLYSPAKRLPFRGAYNGIDISGDGRGCNTILGAFYVHEYVMNNGILKNAAIDFVQTCEPNSTDVYNAQPKLYGSLRYNSTIQDSCDAQGCATAKKYLGFTDKPVTIDKPDLIFGDIDISTGWDANTKSYKLIDGINLNVNERILRILANVKNSGQKNIDYIEAEIKIIDADNNTVYTNIEKRNEALNISEEKVIGGGWSWTPSKIGKYIWQFKIDPSNTFPESDETNNTFTKTVTVIANTTTPKPDLVFREDSFKYYVSDGIPRVYIEVEDVNKVYDLNGLPLTALSGSKNNIFAGSVSKSNYTIGYELYLNLLDIKIDNKAHTITFTADPYNQADESNENNNTFMKTVNIGAESTQLKDDSYKITEIMPITVNPGDTLRILGTFPDDYLNSRGAGHTTIMFGDYSLESENFIMHDVKWSKSEISVKVPALSDGRVELKIKSWKYDNAPYDTSYNYELTYPALRIFSNDMGSSVNDISIENINNTAKNLNENKFDQILEEIKTLKDVIKEQQAQIKYLTKLTQGVKELSEKATDAINNFITYGVDDNTKKLGEGERAAVMYSYKAAFAKLPETEEELADAIKIANGRWPSVTNEDAEKKSKE